MEIAELEARKAEIASMLDGDTSSLDIEALTEEVRGINTQLEERKAQAAKEAELREAVASGEVGSDPKPVIEIEERKSNIMDRNSVEYRDAFFAMLNGTATVEQRGVFADNSAYGDGVALPVATDTAIWDQIHTQHPILADIATIHSGMVLKVTKSTPTSISKKMDSATSAEQTLTNVDVVLAGADYHTYVTLSYAEARMSQGAFEQYLVNEIAAELGEALAKDVFARILTDAAANSTTKASSAGYYATIKTALGKATMAQNPVIYAPADLYYAILGEVDTNGQPVVRDGVVLGAELKKDNAATKVTIVDPAQFVLNVVQEATIESEKDVKAAAFVIGGYMRAEGCLRKTNAAAFIA